MIAVTIILLAFYAWLFRTRVRESFLRAYGLFFMVLLIYASNKEYYGITPAMSEGAFSPLSLIRWGLLGLFLWQARRLRPPNSIKVDAPLAALVVLLICDMMISSIYAESFSYTFMRALSFGLLAFAVVRGLSSYFFSSVNCLQFFRFHYYTAWIVLGPLMVMLLTGLGYGVTIIMGQYAGYFGNQNMFGTFSALITPHVLFHWQAVARKRWEKWLDLGLLGVIFAGLYYSGSRNGLSSCLISIIAYFFVVNMQSRLKILAAGVCLIIAFSISPTLKGDLTSFIRKGTDKGAQVTDLSTQLVEEKRYEMWSGVLPLFFKQGLTGYGFASSHLLVFPFTKDEEAGRALHNSYLEIFGDLGFPGLILLLLILYRVGTKAFVLIQQRGDPLERQISAVFIAIFAAGAANAFFESWMFSVGNLTSLMFWGATSGVVARWAWRPAEARVASGIPGGLKPEMRYTAARAQH